MASVLKIGLWIEKYGYKLLKNIFETTCILFYIKFNQHIDSHAESRCIKVYVMIF